MREYITGSWNFKRICYYMADDKPAECMNDGILLR
jgi:hypothetical protein